MTEETKVCFITGASSGIGEYLAYEYARKGFHIALLARRADRLEQVGGKCLQIDSKVQSKAQSKIEIITCRGDVTHQDDLQQAKQAIVKKWGRVDVVIANAGFGVGGRAERLSVEDYKRQFDVNVFGVLNTFYAFVEELKKTKGSLCIIGSVNGVVAEPKKSAYCMSKFAVHALSTSLYYELKPYGVSVTLVAPGIVESEIRKVDNEGVFQPEVKDRAPQWIRMPTPVAARKIFNAVKTRRKQIVITLHGKVAVFLQRHFPWLMTPLMNLAPKPKDPSNVRVISN